ncbi:MAG: competence protein CoiA family protein [Promethearchaeota archaeon]
MIESSKKESESFEHIKIKDFFFINLPLDNDVKTIKLEHSIGNRIADVYCKLENGKEIVIEIQHSMILSKDLLQRTKEYNEHNCYVLWVFNGSSFERLPKIEDKIRILSFERSSHLLYRGRVYYINMTKSGVHSPVYPLHFANYYEQKISDYGFRYYKKSKTKKSVVSKEIPSLKLKLFKNKGYKLAGFHDNNIRKTCTETLSQFLIDYENVEEKVQNIKKVKPYQKKLFIIIAMFGQEFGLYLLFDVLRRLKVVSKEDFHYMKVSYQYLQL